MSLTQGPGSSSELPRRNIFNPAAGQLPAKPPVTKKETAEATPPEKETSNPEKTREQSLLETKRRDQVRSLYDSIKSVLKDEPTPSSQANGESEASKPKVSRTSRPETAPEQKKVDSSGTESKEPEKSITSESKKPSGPAEEPTASPREKLELQQQTKREVDSATVREEGLAAKKLTQDTEQAFQELMKEEAEKNHLDDVEANAAERLAEELADDFLDSERQSVTDKQEEGEKRGRSRRGRDDDDEEVEGIEELDKTRGASSTQKAASAKKSLTPPPTIATREENSSGSESIEPLGLKEKKDLVDTIPATAEPTQLNTEPSTGPLTQTAVEGAQIDTALNAVTLPPSRGEVPTVAAPIVVPANNVTEAQSTTPSLTPVESGLTPEPAREASLSLREETPNLAVVTPERRVENSTLPGALPDAVTVSKLDEPAKLTVDQPADSPALTPTGGTSVGNSLGVTTPLPSVGEANTAAPIEVPSANSTEVQTGLPSLTPVETGSGLEPVKEVSGELKTGQETSTSLENPNLALEKPEDKEQLTPELGIEKPDEKKPIAEETKPKEEQQQPAEEETRPEEPREQERQEERERRQAEEVDRRREEATQAEETVKETQEKATKADAEAYRAKMESDSAKAEAESERNRADLQVSRAKDEMERVGNRAQELRERAAHASPEEAARLNAEADAILAAAQALQAEAAEASARARVVSAQAAQLEARSLAESARSEAISSDLESARSAADEAHQAARSVITESGSSVSPDASLSVEIDPSASSSSVTTSGGSLQNLSTLGGATNTLGSGSLKSVSLPSNTLSSGSSPASSPGGQSLSSSSLEPNISGLTGQSASGADPASVEFTDSPRDPRGLDLRDIQAGLPSQQQVQEVMETQRHSLQAQQAKLEQRGPAGSEGRPASLSRPKQTEIASRRETVAIVSQNQSEVERLEDEIQAAQMEADEASRAVVSARGKIHSGELDTIRVQGEAERSEAANEKMEAEQKIEEMRFEQKQKIEESTKKLEESEQKENEAKKDSAPHLEPKAKGQEETAALGSQAKTEQQESAPRSEDETFASTEISVEAKVEETAQKSAEKVELAQVPMENVIAPAVESKVEETAQKPAEKVEQAQVPMENVIAPAVESKVEETAQKPAEKVEQAQVPTENVIAPAVEAEVEEIVQKPAEKVEQAQVPMENVTVPAVEAKVEEIIQKPAEKAEQAQVPTENVIAPAIEAKVEEIIQKPAEKVEQAQVPRENVTVPAVEAKVEEIVQKPAEKVEQAQVPRENVTVPAVEAKVEEIVQKPAEKVEQAQVPMENVTVPAVEAKVEEIIQKPAEKVEQAQVPTENVIAPAVEAKVEEIVQKPTDENKSPEGSLEKGLSKDSGESKLAGKDEQKPTAGEGVELGVVDPNSGEKPATGEGEQKPTAGEGVELGVVDPNSGEKPATGEGEQKPTTGEGVELGVVDPNSGEKPATGEGEQKPTAGEGVELGVVDPNSGEKPATGEGEQKPTAGEGVELGVVDPNSGEKPATGEGEQKPTTGEGVELGVVDPNSGDKKPTSGGQKPTAGEGTDLTQPPPEERPPQRQEDPVQEQRYMEEMERQRQDALRAEQAAAEAQVRAAEVAAQAYQAQLEADRAHAIAETEKNQAELQAISAKDELERAAYRAQELRAKAAKAPPEEAARLNAEADALIASAHSVHAGAQEATAKARVAGVKAAELGLKSQTVANKSDVFFTDLADAIEVAENAKDTVRRVADQVPRSENSPEVPEKLSGKTEEPPAANTSPELAKLDEVKKPTPSNPSTAKGDGISERPVEAQTAAPDISEGAKEVLQLKPLEPTSSTERDSTSETSKTPSSQPNLADTQQQTADKQNQAYGAPQTESTQPNPHSQSQNDQRVRLKQESRAAVSENSAEVERLESEIREAEQEVETARRAALIAKSNVHSGELRSIATTGEAERAHAARVADEALQKIGEKRLEQKERAEDTERKVQDTDQKLQEQPKVEVAAKPENPSLEVATTPSVPRETLVSPAVFEEKSETSTSFGQVKPAESILQPHIGRGRTEQKDETQSSVLIPPEARPVSSVMPPQEVVQVKPDPRPGSEFEIPLPTDKPRLIEQPTRAVENIASTPIVREERIEEVRPVSSVMPPQEVVQVKPDPRPGSEFEIPLPTDKPRLIEQPTRAVENIASTPIVREERIEEVRPVSSVMPPQEVTLVKPDPQPSSEFEIPLPTDKPRLIEQPLRTIENIAPATKNEPLEVPRPAKLSAADAEESPASNIKPSVAEVSVNDIRARTLELKRRASIPAPQIPWRGEMIPVKPTVNESTEKPAAAASPENELSNEGKSLFVRSKPELGRLRESRPSSSQDSDKIEPAKLSEVETISSESRTADNTPQRRWNDPVNEERRDSSETGDGSVLFVRSQKHQRRKDDPGRLLFSRTPQSEVKPVHLEEQETVLFEARKKREVESPTDSLSRDERFFKRDKLRSMTVWSKNSNPGEAASSSQEEKRVVKKALKEMAGQSVDIKKVDITEDASKVYAVVDDKQKDALEVKILQQEFHQETGRELLIEDQKPKSTPLRPLPPEKSQTEIAVDKSAVRSKESSPSSNNWERLDLEPKSKKKPEASSVKEEPKERANQIYIRSEHQPAAVAPVSPAKTQTSRSKEGGEEKDNGIRALKGRPVGGPRGVGLRGMANKETGGGGRARGSANRYKKEKQEDSETDVKRTETGKLRSSFREQLETETGQKITVTRTELSAQELEDHKHEHQGGRRSTCSNCGTELPAAQAHHCPICAQSGPEVLALTKTNYRFAGQKFFAAADTVVASSQARQAFETEALPSVVSLKYWPKLPGHKEILELRREA